MFLSARTLTGVGRLAGGLSTAAGATPLVAGAVGLGTTLTPFATPPAVFADRKARREERRLEQVYDGDAAYRARTRRRLIPFVW